MTNIVNPKFVIQEHLDLSLLHRLAQIGGDLIKIAVNPQSPKKLAAKKTFRSYEIAPPAQGSTSSLALMHPDSMEVSRVIHETADAVSLVLG